MDSPPSEKSQTRFSTPVSDLDDHRNQSSTRPRAGTTASPHSPRIGFERRASSVRRSATHPRPELLQVNEGLEIPGAAPITRDFEQVIIDDDKSGTGEHVIERKGSTRPMLTRRSTHRRSQNQPSRSRDPSTCSSSSDNSVDAFADSRRRERANTVGSKAPSELELGLHRTISGGTHHLRPTLKNGSVRAPSIQDDRISTHVPAEDDICFPATDEQESSYSIDFEELEEFVEEHNKAKPPVLSSHHRKESFSAQANYPKAKREVVIPVPRITTNDSGRILDSDEDLDEKYNGSLQLTASNEQAPSSQDPTRYSFFSSELEQVVHAAEFGDLLAPGDTLQELFQVPEAGGVWWLDILNPTEEELHAFQRAFGIHRLTTEDIITQEAREKVELFKQYYFVCFRSFNQIDPGSEDYMDPVNVYMVVFREGIITITYTRSPHAANVRQRISKLRDYMALTADWICYAMIDNIVDSFAPPISLLEQEADTIEDSVFISRTENLDPLLRQIGECRKKVMSLMRLLGGKADVIKGFAKRCNESYNVTPRGEIGLYLGDIQDHVVTMMSNLGHFEKILSRSHSNYLATLSIDHIRQGSRANEVLSKITLLASILVPLNIICGLFGMNVPVPGKNSDGLEWFLGICGVIVAVVVFLLAFARWYRFI